MNAPITTEDREAWLDRAERDLASMRAYLAELEQRWAGIKSEFGLRTTVANGLRVMQKQRDE